MSALNARQSTHDDPHLGGSSGAQAGLTSFGGGGNGATFKRSTAAFGGRAAGAGGRAQYGADNLTVVHEVDVRTTSDYIDMSDDKAGHGDVEGGFQPVKVSFRQDGGENGKADRIRDLGLSPDHY